MAEISTVAIITAKPGRGDELGELLRPLAVATQGEDGCVLYSLQRGLWDRDVFVTVEKWESAAHLDAHLVAPHVETALAAAGDILAEAPKIVPTEAVAVGDQAKSTY